VTRARPQVHRPTTAELAAYARLNAIGTNGRQALSERMADAGGGEHEQSSQDARRRADS
jgi:hypothetical protein